jgi:hypothetical protein
VIKKYIGLALILMGVIVMVISLLADFLGLGGPGPAMLGWKQLLGAGGGLVVALVGLVLLLLPKKS